MLVILKKRKRYRRKKTMDRINRFFDLPIKVIFHLDFKNPTKIKEIAGPFPDLDDFNTKRKELLESNFENIYKEPLLNKDQEVYLFKKMNYFKFIAEKLRTGASRENPDWKKIRLFEKYIKLADAAHKQITTSNLRLAASVAKKFKDTSLTHEEVITEGYYNVWFAATKFDVSFGWRFSTYCTWVVKNNLIRYCEKSNQQQNRFIPSIIAEESLSVDNDQHLLEQHLLLADVVQVIKKLEKNPIVKRQILALRHHIGFGEEQKTLKVAGEAMNITKERVRQLQMEAIIKIKRELKKA